MKNALVSSVLLAIFVILLTLAATHAGIPLEPSLRDYVHTAWTQHDGIALSEISGITQSTDGYLWLTTSEEGLLRFDGVHFVSVTAPCPRPGDIQSDGSGGLWMLCDYKFFHRDSAGNFNALDENLLPSTYRRKAMTFFVDREKRLWFWGRSLAYIRPDGSRGPEIPGTERPRDAVSCNFAEDSNGDIWFGTSAGLLRIRNDRPERVLKDWVSGLAASRHGGVYAVFQGRKVLHITPGSIETVQTFGPETAISGTRNVAETEAGLWIATQDRGVALVRGRKVEFSREDGRSSNATSQLYVDREGSLWAPTTIGLHRFRKPLAYVMNRADGLPPGLPWFVFQDRKEGLWIGTSVTTVRLAPDSGRALALNALYRCIGEDRDGRIWLASDNEMGYLQNDVFVPVRDQAGKHLPGVRSFRVDRAGNLWALSPLSGIYKITGVQPELKISHPRPERFLASRSDGIWIESQDGVLQVTDGRQVMHHDKSARSSGNEHTEAIEDDGDSMWIGARGGLKRWRNGRWTTWTVDHGLPGAGDVFEITTDAQRRLWLVTDAGILVLDRGQLEDTPDGQPRRLLYTRIGSLDRVLPHHGGILTSPRITKSRDGRLFFATFDSIAVIDPSHIVSQNFVPPIVIESVLVNRRPVPVEPGAHFVEPDDVQFEYTSLSLRSPENVRFLYRLEGVDKDWTEAGAQRRAVYSALKPGSYIFRVIGSGSEGVWNNVGAAYPFQITVPFYKKPWFLVLMACAVAALAWLFHRYQLQRESERIRLRMEAKADERLRIAQDMHDTLLQGIQGSGYLMSAAIKTIDSQPVESRRLLERALSLVGDSANEARDMLTSLRAMPATPPKVSLISRLQSLVADEPVLFPNPPHVSFEVAGALRKIRPQLSEDMYLIAREALRNALQHAAASNVRIALQFNPDGLQLSVTDDGVGIDKDVQTAGREGHYGLQGMRERAIRHNGVLRIEGSSGGGTCLVLTVKPPRSEVG